MFMYVLLVGRKVDVCINEVCPQSEYEYCAPNLLETYILYCMETILFVVLYTIRPHGVNK